MMLDKHSAGLLAQFNQNTPDLHDVEISIETSREGARAMFLSLAGEVASHCEVQDLTVATGQHDIPVRIYRPNSGKSPRPVVVFAHGGGWSLGDLDCYDALVRDLCQQSGALFISVGYRLAPEHKFPAGLEDVISVSRWAVSQAQELGGDAARIALMGDSAGGNLVLSASHRLQGELSLAGLYLIYPVLDSHRPHHTYLSRVRFGDGDFLLTREAISDTCSWYLDKETPSDHPEVSPLFLPHFGNLPPTSLLLAGHDPLYDEGRLLADKLRQAGVLRRLHCFESTIHAFVSFGVLPIAQEARAALAQQLRTDLF